ncbi:hypothetical protein Lalb_Chr15g0082191 [Lupinus albus]|uniref:Uncharacterized protein n=1 Tax=Lupinus albus TaxID=3870 RepID=A0A6A4PDA3_LUPAL|nr:hypothetical protein Lalb_Chr15g0082191 [Lupinus albus]
MFAIIVNEKDLYANQVLLKVPLYFLSELRELKEKLTKDIEMGRCLKKHTYHVQVFL